MKKRWLFVIALAAVTVVFAGCSKPDTPQAVAAEFWQALSEGNAKEAADFSTLVDGAAFDGFGRDWQNTLPDFGRIVIEADKATIVTRVPAEDGVAGERQELITYLVQINDQWLVDYQRTRDAASDRPALSGLMSDIDRFSQQLDEAVGETSDKLSEQVDKMAEQFKAYSDETGKQAEEALEDFEKSLEDLRQRIKESLDEARKQREQSRQSESLEQAAI